jgi:hypothetical protein
MTVEHDIADSPLMDRYRDLEKHLGIDMTDLEHAFMATPRILQEAGELAAKADEYKVLAKYAIEVASAEAAQRIREVQVPNYQGKMAEPSQNRIDSQLPLCEEVQQAHRLYARASYEAEVCASLHEAFAHQSRLLSKTADMVVSGFITPGVLQDQRRADYQRARREQVKPNSRMHRPQ